ncbi:MAG: preprotein translocase subunit SecG [Gammaproteobacteria bacterium]|nr:preprotein translocase subunit SecG [Gammaproteobacteria bacterium]
MEMFEDLVLVAHVMAALAIIGLVMIQQGRGAEMGSGFGGGSSNTVFGSAGAGNFLTRATTIVALLFFITSFSLAYFARGKVEISSELGIPSIQKVITVEARSDEISLPELEAEQPSDMELELPDVDGTDDSEWPEW